MRLQYIRLEMNPALAAAALGIGTSVFNDAQQIVTQGILNGQQQKMEQWKMDYQQKKQLEMWNATSYPAQVKKLKEAGLNPGLLYGMSGSGGQTTAYQPGGFEAPRAPHGGGEIEAMIGMGIQNKLAEAQVNALNAQANAANAQAESTRGTAGTVGEAEIQVKQQEYDNKRWEYEILKLDKAFREIRNYEAQTSQADRLKTIQQTAEQAVQQAKIMGAEGKVQEATVNDQIDTIKQHAIGAALANEATKHNIHLTDAQINEIEKTIKQNWSRIDQTESLLKIQRQLADYNTDVDIEILKGLVHSIGTIGGATILKQSPVERPTPIQGFGRGNKY